MKNHGPLAEGLRNDAGNMRLSYAEQIRLLTVLRKINDSYGRGEIVDIDWNSLLVKCKKQYGVEYPKFRVKGNSVTFRNHTRKF